MGAIVLIPRISLIPTEEHSAIQFRRTQFPIRLAFAMTINKAQGRTFDRVGLYLPTPVFTHGLLYVAMSRVRTPSSIKILIEPQDCKCEKSCRHLYKQFCIPGITASQHIGAGHLESRIFLKTANFLISNTAQFSNADTIFGRLFTARLCDLYFSGLSPPQDSEPLFICVYTYVQSMARCLIRANAFSGDFSHGRDNVRKQMGG